MNLGVGARAEITDAAIAERAECVMLNKGASLMVSPGCPSAE